jgi:hypothetical protein
MKVEKSYRIGDKVKVKGHSTPMLVIGFILETNGDLYEYEVVPVEHLHYYSESMIEGLEDE